MKKGLLTLGVLLYGHWLFGQISQVQTEIHPLQDTMDIRAMARVSVSMVIDPSKLNSFEVKTDKKRSPIKSFRVVQMNGEYAIYQGVDRMEFDGSHFSFRMVAKSEEIDDLTIYFTNKKGKQKKLTL